VSGNRIKTTTPNTIGYAHPGYAESLSEFGRLRELPRCKGWVLERQIQGSVFSDAIGCYPMFCCQDWSQLHLDIAELESDLVSLSLVPEVFGAYDRKQLHQCFDTVVPFKNHYICDLSLPIGEIVSKHHQRYARKALKKIICEQHPKPVDFLDEWINLHATLVDRHGISGIRAYSREAFARQLCIPGMVVLRATHNGVTVGSQLWFMLNEVAYGHAQAFSPLGYELGAAYALYWSALEFFADKVRYCDYGGVSGLSDDDTGGLSWFKRGWTTEMRTAYFCGRILNQANYAELVKSTELSANTFFPAYRSGF